MKGYKVLTHSVKSPSRIQEEKLHQEVAKNRKQGGRHIVRLCETAIMQRSLPVMSLRGCCFGRAGCSLPSHQY